MAHGLLRDLAPYLAAVSPIEQSASTAPKSSRNGHPSPDGDGAPHERARVTDWMRAGLPLVALAAFIIVAWRDRFFYLKNPDERDAGAQRMQGISWTGSVL